ncbi:hypothetical protein APHAL10511_007630 [Amanita phalloides]|nr:hypothetical protein APHAL10511_007630 [Amanita phalloides]
MDVSILTMLTTTLLVGSAALVLTLAWHHLRLKSLPYPPGPPPRLIFGNALDIPSEKPWVAFREWTKRLGSDIIHLSALGTHIVVLHKMEDIVELIWRRSTIYSSRPWFPVIDILGMDKISLVMPYGEQWRKHRFFFQEGFGKRAVPLYYPAISDKVQLFLHILLTDPARFQDHCKWFGAAVNMSVMFGHSVVVGETKDHYVSLAERLFAVATELMHPMSTLINAIPPLRHIPPWFPGATTQKRAAEINNTLKTHINEPFESAKNSLSTGMPKECVTTRLVQHRLENGGLKIEDEDDIKTAMATAYIAACGPDTIKSALSVFFMAMALNPLVQKRAQTEIDSVVGTGRLPTFDDRPSLPFIDAVMRETLRWRLVAPLAVAHATTEDDVYKGFFIPKGTIIFPNGWAVSRDESTYANPEAFDPNRFFNPDGTLNDDKIEYAFGYGRRICPGRFLATNTLWMAIVSVLSTFNISKARDENGVEIDIDTEAFSSVSLSLPPSFQCSILPRSRQAEAHIQSAVAKARD